MSTHDQRNEGKGIPKKKHMHRAVVLRAYDGCGDLVEDVLVPYDVFYEGVVPLIDDSALRAARGIRSISGEIYNSSGELVQHFANQYDSRGKYQHGKAQHRDGTVTQD